jgi:predicted Zn-dependent peptidase
MEFSKHVLKNGLRVVLAPMESTQTVTVQILVEAGSKYETKQNNGISHFLEHMMFKGTKKRPSAKIISEQLDQVGGEYNAFTSEEETGYWVKVPYNHFELALDVVSDMFRNSLLKQEEIDRERGVILQEEAMLKDTPMRYVYDVFSELMYGNQPAGWQILGIRENIKNFQRQDFLDYLQNRYLPQNTVVVIAGKIDPDQALKRITKHFETITKADSLQDKPKTIEKQAAPALKVSSKETDQTHLFLGVRGPHMFSSRRFAAKALGMILGGGMSSRTFLNIRERHGLTYYVGSSVETTTDTGFLYVRAGVAHENLPKTVKLITRELQKLRDKPVGTKELTKIKEYFRGVTLMNLESSDAVASFVGNQELFRKKIKKPRELFEKINQLTAEDIQKEAQKMFQDKNLNLAIIGPQEQNQAKLKEIFKFK